MKELLLTILLMFTSASSADVPSNAYKYKRDMQRSAWRTFGLKAPVATLGAQIHQESGWKCDAVSWAGAQGCAQFMPGTARDMAERHPEICSPANPFDPRWAFGCRDRYLKELIAAQHNDQTDLCSDWAFGFRAYNGGSRWITKDRNLAESQGTNRNDWQAIAVFNSGRKSSAFKENTEYPVRIFKLEPTYKGWGRTLDCL